MGAKFEVRFRPVRGGTRRTAEARRVGGIWVRVTVARAEELLRQEHTRKVDQ